MDLLDIVANYAFVLAIALIAGPLSIPVFTAYGLSGGVFLGTDGATSVLLYRSKVWVPLLRRMRCRYKWHSRGCWLARAS